MYIKLLHNIQPLKYPGFAFVWLELLSNRFFLTTVLQNQDFWMDYHQLLLYLFKFFKQNQEILNQPSMQTFYKGNLLIFRDPKNDVGASPRLLRFLVPICLFLLRRNSRNFHSDKKHCPGCLPHQNSTPRPFPSDPCSDLIQIEQIEDFKHLPDMNANFFERKIISLSLQVIS